MAVYPFYLMRKGNGSDIPGILSGIAKIIQAVGPSALITAVTAAYIALVPYYQKGLAPRDLSEGNRAGNAQEGISFSHSSHDDNANTNLLPAKLSRGFVSSHSGVGRLRTQPRVPMNGNEDVVERLVNGTLLVILGQTVVHLSDGSCQIWYKVRTINTSTPQEGWMYSGIVMEL